MQAGQKVLIKSTKQVGTYIEDTHRGIRANVEIQTPEGRKTINVLKAMLVMIEVIEKGWPLIKEIIRMIRGSKEKHLILKDKSVEL